MNLLTLENLRTYFYSRPRRAFVRSVDGVSLAVARGETLGVVGESGSGKTVMALSAAGLVSGSPGVIEGRIHFHSRNLLDGLERFVTTEERDGRIMAVEKDERSWRRHAARLMAGVNGKEIAMIFQNPRAALNPIRKVGRQIEDVLLQHVQATPADATAKGKTHPHAAAAHSAAILDVSATCATLPSHEALSCPDSLHAKCPPSWRCRSEGGGNGSGMIRSRCISA